MNDKIDYNNLKYVAVSSGDEYSFDKLDNPLVLVSDIKKGKVSLGKANNQQQNYYNYLNKIRRGNKNANQKKSLSKFIEDYGSMILEEKKLAKEQEGTGLKILTPNQMLKRLAIALAQIKAGNNSESLLNEIRQIAYSLDRSKEITKKSIQQYN